MNVVILHCHFERGGVTQVVENHVRFLAGCTDVDSVTLISGGRISGLGSETLATAQTVSLEGLDYDSLSRENRLPQDRAAPIALKLERILDDLGRTGENTVLHWHNHSLGKNAAVPSVIKLLAGRGFHQLLQVHDFAEDHRPENYRGLIDAHHATTPDQLDNLLYPQGDTIHYTALTQGDANVLTTLGSAATCLFNSVALPDQNFPDQEQALQCIRKAFQLPATAQWSIYPVRGIRRKNVGEWLLLTALMPADHFSAITLAPTTPAELHSYQRWRELAQQKVPNAVFDAGHREEVRFIDNLSAAGKVISTSVAEGFGMMFLEPWLAGKEVIARRLPAITCDFENAGVDLDHFYDSLQIPGHSDWLRQQWETARLAFANLQAQLPPAFQLPPTFQADLQASNPSSESIDFALLSPSIQARVIERVQEDQSFKRDVVDLNRELMSLLTSAPDENRIQRNGEIIRDHYCVTSVGERLLRLYKQILSGIAPRTMRHQTLGEPPESVLSLVNRNRPFFPCRTAI